MTEHDDDFRSWVGPPRPESPWARAQAIAIERLPQHERAHYLTSGEIGAKYARYLEEELERLIVEGQPKYPPVRNPATITDESRRLAIGAELQRLRSEWQGAGVDWNRTSIGEAWRLMKAAPREIRWLLDLVEGTLPEDISFEEDPR
jgi:hypothetical protein